MNMPFFLSLLLGLSLLQCKSPTSAITESWTDDSAQPPTFKKVLVIAITKNGAVRRYYENQMVKKLATKNVTAVASLDGIPAKEEISPETFRKYFSNKNIDAVLVSRPVEVKELPVFVPGDSGTAEYANFYSYYNRVYGKAPAPGSFGSSTLVRLVTNLFDLASGQAVYSCKSNSYAHGNGEQVMDELTGRIAKDLKRKGFFK